MATDHIDIAAARQHVLLSALEFRAIAGRERDARTLVGQLARDGQARPCERPVVRTDLPEKGS